MNKTKEQWLIKVMVLVFLGIALIQLLLGRGEIERVGIAVLCYGTLYAGFRWGPGTGTAAGTLLGLVAFLLQRDVLWMAGLAAGGLLAGAFCRLGRLGSLVALACGVWGIETWQTGTLSGGTMGQVMTAGVLFVLTPESMLRIRRSPKKEQKEMDGLRRKQLEETADSYGKLARSLSELKPEPEQIDGEQVRQAMEKSCNLVCGDCRSCRLGNREWEQVNIRSLSHTFETSHGIRPEDLWEDFEKECPRSQQYLEALGDCLGSSPCADGWKGRFLESREAASLQFREIEKTLNEMANKLDQAEDVTDRYERRIRQVFRQKGLVIKNLLILKEEEKRLEVFLTLRGSEGKCVTVREITNILGHQLSRAMIPEEGGRTVVGRETCEIHFMEKPSYRLLSGMAKATKKREEWSGDTFSCHLLPGQQMMLCLSDGMGSGREAFLESRAVVEFLEELMDAGFSPERAISMLNGLLVVQQDDRPVTLDLGIVDLYTGQARFYKQGAVSTFLIRNREVLRIDAGALPLGMDCRACPSATEVALGEGDRIVMVTDGVLEALPGEDKEQAMCRFLENHKGNHAGELADDILSACLTGDREAMDDMTILVGGLWQDSGIFANRKAVS
jgi:stage II sporulation protein E